MKISYGGTDMADKKETEQDKQPLTFGRTLNLLNQGVESMVASTLSLPALVADGYLNIYRAGRQALGGKSFEASNLYEKSKQGLINAGRELDGTAGKVIGPQNGTEENIVLGADIASSILIPTGLAGLATKAKTVATVSNAARIEPTLNAAAAQATQAAGKAARIEPTLGTISKKAVTETVEATVKKTTSHGHMTADEVAARLKAAAASEKAGVKAADTLADSAKTVSAAEKAGMKTADATADGLKVAAGAEKTEAGFQGVTGWLKARTILHSPMSLGEKVRQFTKAGREDLAEKVLVQARQKGLTEVDMDKIRRIDGAPNLIKKYEDLFTMQQGKGLDAKIDMVSAKLFGNATTAAGTLGHASLAGAKLYKDALFAPITLAKLTYNGLRGPNAARNIALGGTALLGTSAMDVATDGESSVGIRSLGSTAASAYGWFLEKNLNGAINAGEWAYSLKDSEAAKRWAEKARQSGQEVLENIPGTIERTTGVKQEQMAVAVETLGNVPGVGMVARPVADALKVKAGIDAARNAQTTVAAAGSEGGATTATGPSGTPGSSARERAAGAVATAQAKVEGVKDKAEEALEGALGKINIGAVLTDPASAWTNLKKAAAHNPQLAGLMEVGEKYPGMKWGILGGMALGAFSGDGAKGKIGSAIMSAVVLGFMFDVIAGFMGKPSMVGQMVASARSGNPVIPARSGPETAATPPVTPPQMNAAAKDHRDSSIRTGVNLRQGFGSALSTTTSLETTAASTAERPGLGGAFGPVAGPAITPVPGQQLSQAAPERKLAANAPSFHQLVSNT